MSPALKGLDFLLKRGDAASGSATFTTVAGLRATSMTIGGESVNVTNKDSSGLWRELLDGGGEVSLDVSASGVFMDDASQVIVEDDAVAKQLWEYQLIFGGGRTYEAQFQVTSVEYSGDHNAEHTYSIELESAGEPTITPSV